MTAPWTLPPPVWRPCNREYHIDRAISSTGLKKFRESPEMFRRIRAGEEPPEPMTTPMVLGSAVHTLLTEPERADRDIWVVKGAATRRGNKVRDAQEDRPHQLVLSEEEWAEAEGIANAILQPKTGMAELARELLVAPGGIGEYAHRWTEDVGGVPVHCRLKVDTLRPIGNIPCQVELKSCRDPEPVQFGRDFEDREYHVQGSHYSRGLLTIPEIRGPVVAAGLTSLPLIVVAVRNAPPYEVCVHQVRDEALAAGLDVLEKTYARLAACLSGAAPWCQPWEVVTSRSIPLLPRPFKRSVVV